MELLLDVSGDSTTSQVISTVDVDGDTLGSATVTLPVPADLPSTLETPGMKVGYRIKVIVDRKMRSDESRERPIVLS